MEQKLYNSELFQQLTFNQRTLAEQTAGQRSCNEGPHQVTDLFNGQIPTRRLLQTIT